MSVKVIGSVRAKLEPHVGIKRPAAKQSCEATRETGNTAVWQQRNYRKYGCAGTRESQPLHSLEYVTAMQHVKEQMQKRGRKKWHAMLGTLKPHLTPQDTTFLTGLQMDGLVLTSIFMWHELRRRQDALIVFYMIFRYDRHIGKTFYSFIQNMVIFLE